MAQALIDKVVPVRTSTRASEPPGWEGGYLQLEDGARYAVTRGTTAVVVTTNEQQSLKAREAAKQVIAAIAD